MVLALKLVPLVAVLVMVHRVLGARVLAALVSILAAVSLVFVVSAAWGPVGTLWSLVILGVLNRVLNPTAWLLGDSISGGWF